MPNAEAVTASHTNARLQPPSTSEGKCTPRPMRLTPIAATTPTVATTAGMWSRRGTEGKKTRSRTPYVTADPNEWPLGKLGSDTRSRGRSTAGLARSTSPLMPTLRTTAPKPVTTV
jgi:hypothetical protein